MGWATIVALILSEGIPVAHAIWAKWQSGAVPTEADWQELITLSKQTAEDRAKQRLALAGIALDDPRAVELLKLVGSVKA